jgi:type III restriction enzyme
MADRVIDNPIINSPYHAPVRHFAFDNDGITDRIVADRRESSYFVPVPRPRKRGAQQQLEFAELTADQIEKNQFVNDIRARVARWREMGRPDVTPVTRRLLEYWTDPERDNPMLFCQLEAAETAIYIAEAAQKAGDTWIRNGLDLQNEEHNARLNRVALKMATGTGKTVVMAMLIAWQMLNKVASPQDARFAKRFLIVTPGLTIRDRLRVLRPEHEENYYKLRDLVPADLKGDLSQARIVITNFHALQRRETKQGQGIAKTSKELLAGYSGAPSPFLESWSQMVSRVCRDLGGTSEIVVFNDEAHHCYRGRYDHPETEAATDKALTAEEKAEAKANSKAARVWFTGLRVVADKLGVKAIYDLSATPSFLSGSGYQEGTLFPWVVSDFGLVEAIESGIVKIPRVPVDDNAVSVDVTYLNLWSSIGPGLPKKSRKEGTVSPENLPPELEGALHSLYGSYEKAFTQWQGSQAAKEGEPPPVFIVVCNNTTVSKMVYDYIAGWDKPVGGDGKTVPAPGKLPLFSNVQDGAWAQRPRTILVDSEQLESGEALSPEFKQIAATEIEEFTADYLRRFPGRSAEDIDDAQILREVMNTVGKTGKLGEPVRCVVSVSMLTEGWDANTVSHILGVRAFGTQLLCEQVVGRGLRRRSYAADENGFFTPEYADVYGVPFQFIPTVAKTKDLTLKPTRRVHADPGRAAAQITFPRLTGYRIELPDEKLWSEFTERSHLVLTTADLPTETVVSGLIGTAGTHTLDDLRQVRDQEIAFHLAGRVMERFLTDGQDPKPWYFPQMLRITKDWLAQCVTCEGDTFPGLLLIAENADQAARLIFHESISSQPGNRTEILRPMLRTQDPAGTTADVDFFTTKEVYPTSEERCHVNFVVLDGPRGNTWEEGVAQLLEAMPQVAAYVKNDHLGFTVPYVFQGRSKQYLPDFLVRLKPLDEDEETRTLIVEVSGSHKPPGPTKEKAETARNLWVPAVNNHGGFAHWSYCELKDPANFRQDLEAAIAALRAGIGASAVMAP